MALDGRAAALRFGDHAHDLRQQGFAAHALGAHDERPRGVDGGADHARAGTLLHRHRFAGNHGFVHRAGAFEHDAVHRYFFAGPHPQPIAGLYLVNGNVGFGAVGVDAPRHLRRQIEQRADGLRCAAAGAQFQHLPQKHQRGNGRSRLVINIDDAVFAERLRKNSRRDRRHHAVPIRHAHADTDQREHVGVAVFYRRPRALKERPSRPQHDRSRQRQLAPSQHPARKQVLQRGRHVAHGDREERDGERQAGPEAARHVAQFGILRLRRGDGARLQCHAADRARARLLAHDLRVHGAHPLGPGRGRGNRFRLKRHAALGTRARSLLAHLRIHGANVDLLFICHGRLRGGWRRLRRQVFFRLGAKPLLASRIAEVIRLAPIVDFTSRVRRIHHHPANRIALRRCHRRGFRSADAHQAGRRRGSRSSQADQTGSVLQIFLGLGRKFPGTSRAAEVIRAALMLRRRLGASGIHAHAANRIFRQRGCGIVHASTYSKVQGQDLRQLCRPSRLL